MRTLRINLDAIVHNLDVMRARANGAKVMGVVKANAYGHGAIPVAKTLERAGVDYLGVADVREALELRDGGIQSPILAWLHDPADNFETALTANIDLCVANLGQLQRIAKAAAVTSVTAKLHLKIDTGLGRNGSTEADWTELLEAVQALGESVSVIGIFSHLSTTSHVEDLAQIKKFDSAVAEVKRIGLTFEFRHLTASDGSLAYPEAHYEMVRIGAALYGLDPFSTNRSAEFGLIPAMTAVSRVAQVKTVRRVTGLAITSCTEPKRKPGSHLFQLAMPKVYLGQPRVRQRFRYPVSAMQSSRKLPWTSLCSMLETTQYRLAMRL